MQGRSTVTQLLSFYHTIGENLDKGLQTVIVTLDLAKAFDSVSHKRLLLKLSRYGIGEQLLQWFNSYLEGRSQRCVVHGCSSNSLPVLSGVPQGSILGPLLFLVFFNDLPTVVDSQVALFADDSKCAQVINRAEDCELLQEHLDNLHCCSQDRRLKFNSSKCEVFTVTRKYEPIYFNYRRDGTTLNAVSKVRDLGVIVSSDLMWDRHIDSVFAKGYKMLSFLRRHSIKSFDVSTRKLLYNTFVRSYVGYASELWAPQNIINISKIERLQRRASKYILNVTWLDNSCYQERLSRLNMIPLAY